jgi:hypothetical protein
MSSESFSMEQKQQMIDGSEDFADAEQMNSGDYMTPDELNQEEEGIKMEETRELEIETQPRNDFHLPVKSSMSVVSFHITFFHSK